MGKSKKKSNTRKFAGGALLILGAFLIVYALGYIQLPSVSALSVSSPPGGISVTSNIVNYPLLANVGPGGIYYYTGTISNTGTVGWDDSWACFRILKTTSTPVLITHATYGGEQFWVGQCGAFTDNLQCREDIESSFGWDMQQSDTAPPSANWVDAIDSQTGDQVYCPTFGVLSPGQSKTFYIRVTVPSTAGGSFPIIATGAANVAGGGWILASRLDTLNVGVIAGDFTFVFAGAAVLILGLGVIFGRPF